MSATAHSGLAINGGEPLRSKDKPWPAWPMFDDKERQAVNAVLESGKWWYGEEVRQFEAEYAAFQDAAHCVTCTSGTTAIEVVLQALGIGRGDEVIVPPYTFVATASAVARVGATPVFVDVDDSWCMNPALAKKAVTSRTKAIMPVHFAGRVADMDAFEEIARRNELALIEDACHSWGSKWKGKGTGALGDCGVFSFQVSKNITAGEGGAIVTDDPELAARCRSITNCGRMAGGQWYEHPLLGTNARMTEFQGAILRAQLSRLEEQTRVREKNAAMLDDLLADIPGLAPQPGDERISRRGYHLYCIRLDPDAFGCSREKLVAAAVAEGLPLGTGYLLPLYKQPVFASLHNGQDYAVCRCPIAEDLCARSGMWLPHTLLLGTDEDMNDVAAVLRKVQAHATQL